MASTSAEKRDNALIGLEAARFLAAFAILAHHYPYLFLTGGIGLAEARASAPFQAVLDPFFDQGWAAVQMFWCMSGFLFAWKYGDPIRLGEVSLRRFAVLRLSR